MIIGLGIDVVSVVRIEKACARSGRFAERILTGAESDMHRERNSPACFLAGRFCAKEAVLKALGTGLAGGVGFRDIEILNDAAGAPTAALSGRALEVCRQLGGKRVLISISTEKEYAAAMAVIENE